MKWKQLETPHNLGEMVSSGGGCDVAVTLG